MCILRAPAPFLFLVLLFAPATVRAQRTQRTQRTQRAQRAQRADSASVVAIEREWLAALSDSATLERVLAPDFVHQLASGDEIGKREHIAFVVAHPLPRIERVFERLDVRLYGTTAIATGIVRANADPPQRTVFTDVFVKRAGRWQAVSAQETPIVARVVH
jgi:hypothetical protein